MNQNGLNLINHEQNNEGLGLHQKGLKYWPDWCTPSSLGGGGGGWGWIVLRIYHLMIIFVSIYRVFCL